MSNRTQAETLNAFVDGSDTRFAAIGFAVLELAEQTARLADEQRTANLIACAEYVSRRTDSPVISLEGIIVDRLDLGAVL